MTFFEIGLLDDWIFSPAPFFKGDFLFKLTLLSHVDINLNPIVIIPIYHYLP